MSFAGHVLDMIQRSRVNRAMSQRSKIRFREKQQKIRSYSNKKENPIYPGVDNYPLDKQIRNRIIKKADQENARLNRQNLIIILIIITLSVLILVQIF